ncbi:MAG: LuxR C-terminal-related transcriptional regulator [Rhodobacteraceae bacterium]|jgi:DNA-binding NarL/FixJ family response regulator|nr:LuxR C-terminal-related transcriptional regulator [Paracoccaceae bacterium]
MIHRILPRKYRALLKRWVFGIAALLQLGCGAVFLSDLISEWRAERLHAQIELVAVFALVLGAVLFLREALHLTHRNARVERELQAASGAFQHVMEQNFDDWGLTPAERDVALLSIKGVPIAEIARLRETREGTIKAQSTAIYRKVGVSNRAELIAVMVEELIGGVHGPEAGKAV